MRSKTSCPELRQHVEIASRHLAAPVNKIGGLEGKTAIVRCPIIRVFDVDGWLWRIWIQSTTVNVAWFTYRNINMRNDKFLLLTVYVGMILRRKDTRIMI